MMNRFDTLLARLLLISLLGISVVHLASLWTFEDALHRELSTAQDVGLADRLMAIRRSVLAAPEGKREGLAHDLSGGAIEAHWSKTRGATAGGPGSEAWASLANHLVRHAGQDLKSQDVVIGTTSDPHVALLSLRLPDDSWLNFNLFASGRANSAAHGTVLSTSLMALGVACLAFLIAGWLTRPLRQMADAVSQLSPDDPAPAVPESGFREVRQLATAFNQMKGRLADLITRRTRALAAVSHDLRTPLTRMRLRINDIGDAELQRLMVADIDEMEQMIEATLSYLKGGETEEPIRAVDLVALLETIVDGAKDMGATASIEGASHLVVHARVVALRRAFANLIGNALRFGSEVRVTVLSGASKVSVSIDDNGPGIPEDKLAAVFEPFVRLETSRNNETGGVGLGLTIAKTNIEACGGVLRLQNRAEGGLSAIVDLPLSANLARA